MIDEISGFLGRPLGVDIGTIEFEADLECFLHDLALVQHRVVEKASRVGLIGVGGAAGQQHLLEFVEDHGARAYGTGARYGSPVVDKPVGAPGARKSDTQGLVVGVVDSFDIDAGLGIVSSEKGSWMFHCTTIADGSRHIEERTRVAFIVRAGGPGRWEAFDVTVLP